MNDVMRYVLGMPMIRNLTASLDDPALSERVLAAVAAQYAARQRPNGVWVRAAAWLVTARRALPSRDPRLAALSPDCNPYGPQFVTFACPE